MGGCSESKVNRLVIEKLQLFGVTICSSISCKRVIGTDWDAFERERERERERDLIVKRIPVSSDKSFATT